MKIPNDIIEDLKKSTDLVKFISQYIELKNYGDFSKGLCPFHSEKSPSFTVNKSKGFYKCFGCNAGGDVLTFIMKYFDVTFYEAVGELAKYHNVELGTNKFSSEYKPKPQNKSNIKQKKNESLQFIQEEIFYKSEGNLIRASNIIQDSEWTPKRAIRIAINRTIINKNDNGVNPSINWENVTLTICELIEELGKGYSFCISQLKDGKRKSDNFVGIECLCYDFDNKEPEQYLSIDDFFNLEISNYCKLLYTTPSHTKELNRYRVLFVLPTYLSESIKAKQTIDVFFQKYFPNADKQATLTTMPFYGNSNGTYYNLNNGTIIKYIRGKINYE